MIKQFLIGLGTVAMASTSVALAATYSQSKIDWTDNKNHTIFYDDHYFGTKEKLLAYYIKKHPEAISTKNVLGDVGHSIIDYDDGILNQNTLYDYDFSKMSPVYYTSSGRTTPSYEDALSTYGNRVFVKTRYEGVKNIFYDKEEAREERKRLISNLNMGYYEMVSPTGIPKTLKINPLNQDDTNMFKDLFSEAINNNETLNSQYQRKFDFSSFDFEEDIIDTNSIYKPLCDLNDGNEIITISSDFDNQANGPDDSRYCIFNDDYKNDGIKTPWLNDIKINFFGSNQNPLPFSLKTNQMERGGDWGYTDIFTKVIDKKDKSNDGGIYFKNKLDTSEWFNEGSSESTVEISCMQSDKKWTYKLNENEKWKAFAKNVKDKQKEISKVYGSNYNMTLTLKGSDKYNVKDLKNGNDFHGLKFDYYDPLFLAGYGDDSISLRYLNLQYFDFEVKFTESTTDKSIITNFEKMLEDYANNNANSLDGGKNIVAMLNTLCDSEIDNQRSKNLINFDETNNETIIKYLRDSFINKYSSFLKNENITENIQIVDGEKFHNLFKVIRDDNGSKDFGLKKLVYNNVKPPIEKEEDSNLKEESDIEYYIDINELLENISKDVPSLSKNYWKEILNFIIKPYEEEREISQKLVNALNNFKAQVWKIDMIPLDSDNKQFQNFYQLFKVHLQSLNKYLNKNKSSLKSMQDYKDSIFLKNVCFDVNNTFFIPNNFIEIKKGVYVLVNELMFNSGLFSSSTGNIGPDNIFSGPKATEKVATYRDVVIKSEPPAIRVMYNIDGEAILGDMSKDGQSSIYDSEELMVAEARVRAKVRRDTDYVYYKNENGMNEQVLNIQSNIYVLSLIGHSERYFIDYTHLRNYLTEWLMTKALVLD